MNPFHYFCLPLLLVATLSSTRAQYDQQLRFPEEKLPPYIEKIYDYGERSEFSHDGKRLMFVTKAGGEVMEMNLETRAVRQISTFKRPKGVGFYRALYLANGDYLLTGGPGRRECVPYILDKSLRKRPTILKESLWEGPAISRKNLKIAYTPEHMTIVLADIVYEKGTPRFANKRVVMENERSIKLIPEFEEGYLEPQNFNPQDERYLTFAQYGKNPFRSETMYLDLETGEFENLTRLPGQEGEPEGIFPDGQYTCVESQYHRSWGEGYGQDVYRLSLTDSEDFLRLTHFGNVGRFKATNLVISDDGKWMAFQMGRQGDAIAGAGYGLFLMDLEKAMKVLADEEAVRTREFRIEPSTVQSLGFEWYIEGDENRNAQVDVAYRKQGDAAWQQGMPLLRIGMERAGEPVWAHTTPNMFAGSILDLEPGTAYECRFRLSDPDGVLGLEEKVVDVRTRAIPKPSAGGEVRHVYPKDWEGPKEEPAYNGLLHAYYGYPRFADWILTTDPVEAGDRIVVHAGTYQADYTDYRDYHGLTFDGTYFFTRDGTEEQPIVIQAAGDGEVIFDGNGSAVLMDFTAADHHYVEGITLQNAEVAIRAGLMNAYGADGLSVVGCTLRDIGIGIQAQYEGSQHFYIADNTFIGREDTNRVYHSKREGDRRVQRIRSYYAVKVHGQGHTICYNLVKYFFDGIDICTHAQPEREPARQSVAIDFYNNDVFLCNDNFIEADGGTHNIRILRNRCFNSGQQALSNQPVLAGPVYWIRNVVYNCGDASTFKFWGMFPAGVIAYHNTSSGILTRDDKPGSNLHFRNNLFLPSDDASLATLGMYTYTAYSSFDYNGYRQREPFISWHAPREGRYDFRDDQQAVSFPSLEAFSKATGQEQHGVLVDYDIFVDAQPPKFREYHEQHAELGRAFPIYTPEQVDFRLKAGSVAVDAGCELPGVNDDYNGQAPDLGAYEHGDPIPHYGPRPKLER